MGLIAGSSISFAIPGYTQSGTTLPDTFHEKFVAIGHHKLFIKETGPSNAKFTVVFESGAGGSSQDWEQVTTMLPPGIRTIAYDRAGTGKSEAGPIPQTMAQEVFELHELLNAIKIKAPVILVGQSLGGLLARLYTERYGKNIAGIVLVDPTHESSVLGSMKYGGWVRLREKAAGKAIPKPQIKQHVSEGYDSTADYMAEEFQKIYLSGIENPQQLKNRPLVIIGAGKRNQPPGTPDEQWAGLRKERDKHIQDLSILSGNSKFILDPASSHQIQNDNPAIVATAVKMVIHSIISKSRL